MIWALIVFLVLMIFACLVTYKTTKHHELHKIRAAFDYKIQTIKEIRKLHGIDEENSNHGENLDFLRGEEDALIEAERIIDEEDKEF